MRIVGTESIVLSSLRNHIDNQAQLLAQEVLYKLASILN